MLEEPGRYHWEAIVMKNNFQRVGSISNTHAGREFEEAAQLFFSKTGISPQRFSALVGREIPRP